MQSQRSPINPRSIPRDKQRMVRNLVYIRQNGFSRSHGLYNCKGSSLRIHVAVEDSHRVTTLSWFQPLKILLEVQKSRDIEVYDTVLPRIQALRLKRGIKSGWRRVLRR